MKDGITLQGMTPAQILVLMDRYKVEIRDVSELAELRAKHLEDGGMIEGPSTTVCYDRANALVRLFLNAHSQVFQTQQTSNEPERIRVVIDLEMSYDRADRLTRFLIKQGFDVNTSRSRPGSIRIEATRRKNVDTVHVGPMVNLPDILA